MADNTPDMSYGLITQLSPWRSQRCLSWTVHSAGRLDCGQFARAFPESEAVSPTVAAAYFTRLPGHFGIIAEEARTVVAATDRVRGYPIFYCSANGRHFFSNDARELRDRFGLDGPAHISLLEAVMAGYVTGRRTLVEGLFQLQAGEVAVLDKVSGSLTLNRYYEFLPTHADETSEETSDETWIERLAAATEATFTRLIADAGDRPLVVPLSGGLDSRLVIAMLRTQGARDLRAFSYGPAHNEEAQRARVVAEKLGVPWTFFPSTQKSARRLFRTPQREAYWRFADGLCSAPNMQEFQIFSELTASNWLPPGAVMVNGQSGDFITGAHLPPPLATAGADGDVLFSAVVAKHFSLWRMLRTPANLATVRIAFESDIKSARERGYHDAAHLFEYWEWQERQSKFVVHQQRTYDFFGFAWMLPLWDREYCELWPDVPIHLKLGQKLYKDYLRRWDSGGLFTDDRLMRPMKGWPGLSQVVPPLARTLGFVGGEERKQKVYARMKYYGYYRNQFGAYPYSHFWPRAGDARNAVSLFAETWLDSVFPAWMDEHFSVSPTGRRTGEAGSFHRG